MDYQKPPIYQNYWNATSLVSTFDVENIRRLKEYNKTLMMKQKEQKKGGCRGCAPREMVLCALVIFFAAASGIILTLYFSKSEMQERKGELRESKSNKNTCNNEACVSVALDLVLSIDMSVDPCDDFYEFACGNWIKNHKIPDDKPVTGITDGLRENLQHQLKELLEVDNLPTNEPQSVLDAHTMYKSCLDIKTIEQLGSRPITEMVDMYGGWPMVNPSWNSYSYDIMDVVGKLSNLGVGVFINSHVVPSFEDSTVNVMIMNQAGLGMPSREYFLGSRYDPKLMAYERYIYEVIGLLGANPAVALEEAKMLVNFEIELAKILIPAEMRRTLKESFKNRTIGELYTDITDRIDWLKYFKHSLSPTGKTVDEDFSLLVFDSDYFHRLGLLWEAFDKRTVANYLMWRLVKANMLSYPSVFYNTYLKYQAAISGRGESRPRWKLCIADISQNMGMAVGRLYVEKFFDKEAKHEAEDMIDHLKQTFLKMLDKAEWLDDATRSNAWKKAVAMQQKIGFPDYIFDDDELKKMYGGLNVHKANFLQNTLNRAQTGRKKNLEKLSATVDDSKWILGPAVFNAYYAWLQNEIVFPAGLFQRPIFDKNYPKYINFGGVGFIIGHEITHGFDDQGSHFDEYGNLNDWWTPYVRDNFHIRSACMQRQYSNFSVPGIEEKVNGRLTLGENIADNGGVKESYNAYRMWVDLQGAEEADLPGLDFTPNQLFFISYAQQFCSKATKELTQMMLRTDKHSPGRLRTIGALQNMEQFSEAFQCKKGSYMNPQTKCTVW